MRLILMMLLMSAMNLAGQADQKLIYVGDPMCSWCYGFGPQLEKLVEHYEGKLELEIVMGGLRPYFDKPIGEMKDFLSEHWKEVHEASGQVFRYGILDRMDLNYDTEPPCRAVRIVRGMAPEKELQFFKACQSAFYFDNKHMGSVESYVSILNELEISVEGFRSAFDSVEAKAGVKEDFVRAEELGVRSFPTVLLQNADGLHIVAQGYVEAEQIQERVEKLRR